MVHSTRVPVRTVLASLAEGATVEEILKDFPSLTAENIQAIAVAKGGEQSAKDQPPDQR